MAALPSFPEVAHAWIGKGEPGLAERPALVIMPVGGIIRRHGPAAGGEQDDEDDQGK